MGEVRTTYERLAEILKEYGWVRTTEGVVQFEWPESPEKPTKPPEAWDLRGDLHKKRLHIEREENGPWKLWAAPDSRPRANSAIDEEQIRDILRALSATD